MLLSWQFVNFGQFAGLVRNPRDVWTITSLTGGLVKEVDHSKDGKLVQNILKHSLSQRSNFAEHIFKTNQTYTNIEMNFEIQRTIKYTFIINNHKTNILDILAPLPFKRPSPKKKKTARIIASSTWTAKQWKMYSMYRKLLL